MSQSDNRFESPVSRSAIATLLGDTLKTSSQDSWLRSFPEIVGRSQSMSHVLDTVAKVAKSDSAVLIRGESGTGKELVAKAIHRISNRAHKPFLALNCSAIPENLLESQLFGHERGAFTGADKRHQGYFERVSGGTLFLDEIGDMAPSLQAKLLRVLQEKKFTPVGSKNLIDADVRIVTATHVDLDLAITKGQFRPDLYYRINVLPITIPPLRERRDDIPLLLEYFLENAVRLHNPGASCHIDSDAMLALQKCSWPGNIRQLQNLVERLVVLKGSGTIGLQDLPRELTSTEYQIGLPLVSDLELTPTNSTTIRSSSTQTPYVLNPRPNGVPFKVPENLGVLPETGFNLINFIEELENSLITQALERTENNRNQAAKLLGMNRTTLVERIKKRKIVDVATLKNEETK